MDIAGSIGIIDTCLLELVGMVCACSLRIELILAHLARYII